MKAYRMARGVAAVGLAVGAVVSSHAAGTAILDVQSQGNQFHNEQSGKIKADATALGGAATAVSGQRIVAPVLTFRATIRSNNNIYRNAGTIEATARAGAGVATAVAGQDVTM